MLIANPNPEQLARDNIERLLGMSGWVVQNKSSFNLSAARGVAVRGYQTDIGPFKIKFVNLLKPYQLDD